MYLHLLQLWAKLLLCGLLFPVLLTSQIRSELDLKDKPSTAFDALVDEIRVPEIDPRQYIIIYEWDSSNENKFRSGIRDENRLRSVGRYQQLYEQELTKLKEQAVLKEKELRLNVLEIDKNEIIYDSLANNIDEEYKLFRVENELNKLWDENEQAKIKLAEIQSNIENIEKAATNNNYTRDYLQWEYGKGKDDAKFRDRKPFDFFDDVGTDYAGTLENYEEYYNEVVWRNAGTPDWEPIWWLNQYPWPNMDYRNIDLVDQDYRDQHFALIPYQKYEVLDRKAVLRIVFDKTQLARNEHFKGSIGLDAFLYEGTSDGSQGGDPREIEINPYSVIGEERKSIGLLNRPAGELADNLIVLVKKANGLKQQAQQFYNTQDGFFSTSEDQVKTSQFFRVKITKTLELIDSALSLNAADVTDPTDPTDSTDVTAPTDSTEKNINAIKRQIKRNIEELIRVSESKNYNTAIDNDTNFGITSDNLLYGALEDHPTLEDLKSALIGLRETVNESDDSEDILVNFRENLNHLKEFREDLRPVITYLDYFDAEVGNTRDAFLNLIGKDRIDFNYLIQRIKDEVNRIDTTLIGLNSQLLSNSSIDTSTKTANNSAPDSEQLLDRYRIVNQQLTASLRQIGILLERMVDIQGSPLSFAIRTLSEADSIARKKYEDDYGEGYDEGYNDGYVDSYENSFYDENEKLMTKLDQLFTDNKSREKLRSYIAEKAGEILYQDLVFGTIDLDMADAGDGDLLFIRMYWDKEAINIDNDVIAAGENSIAGAANDKEASSSSPQRDGVALYVAKFKLTDRGWQAKTNDNFMLVNRVGEDLLRPNYPLNSTRFKPTGGVSLTWGLRNDYRINKRIRFDPVTDLPRFDRNGRLQYNKLSVFAQRTFKWLEPSFGVNFTYLDFTEEETFEVGVGPSLGLFNNTFYLSTGWNLMELKERPFYFGIGASILNLGSKVN